MPLLTLRSAHLTNIPHLKKERQKI
jgi:hypothetical protein